MGPLDGVEAGRDPLDAVLVAGEEDVVGKLTGPEPDVVLPLAGGDCDACVRVWQGPRSHVRPRTNGVRLRPRIGAGFRERQAVFAHARPVRGPCVGACGGRSGPARARGSGGQGQGDVRDRSRRGAGDVRSPAAMASSRATIRCRSARCARWRRASVAATDSSGHEDERAERRRTRDRRPCPARAEARSASLSRLGVRGDRRRVRARAGVALPRSPTSSMSAASPTTSTTSSRRSGTPVALSASPGSSSSMTLAAASASTTWAIAVPSSSRKPSASTAVTMPPVRTRGPRLASRSRRSMSGDAGRRSTRRRRPRRCPWPPDACALAAGRRRGSAPRRRPARARGPTAAGARRRTAVGRRRVGALHDARDGRAATLRDRAAGDPAARRARSARSFVVPDVASSAVQRSPLRCTSTIVPCHAHEPPLRRGARRSLEHMGSRRARAEHADVGRP